MYAVEVEQGGLRGCAMPPCLRLVALWTDRHGGGGADGCEPAVYIEAARLARHAPEEMERADELATDMQRTANELIYLLRTYAELCRAECRQQYQGPKV